MPRPFVVAHISDLHCGSPYFVASLMERTIIEINDLRPDVIVRLPSDRVVVIDAKVPLAAYLDAVEAGDDYHRDQALGSCLLYTSPSPRD